MKSSRHSGGLGFSSPTARKIIALDGVNETSLEPKPDPKSMEVLPGNKVPISNPTATEAVGEVKVDTPMVKKDKRAKKVKGVTKFEQLDPKDDSVDLVVEGEGEHSTPKRTRLHLVIKRRKTSTEVAKKE
tara:strand:+ start:3931 stop:4320 length:390 start_codon:yes stop_codon:yes gene_type:complete